MTNSWGILRIVRILTKGVFKKIIILFIKVYRMSLIVNEKISLFCVKAIKKGARKVAERGQK